jgi:hypothetical protein
MTSSTKTYGVDVCGDRISVEWNGSVWVCPTSGAQFGRPADALCVELLAHLRGCGVAEDEIEGEIGGYLAAAE